MSWTGESLSYEREWQFFPTTGRDNENRRTNKITKKKNSTPTPVGMEFSISEGDHEKLMDIAGFCGGFSTGGKGKYNLIIFI